MIDRQIDRGIDRQIDRYIDRQIHRYIDRQIDRQIHRQINVYNCGDNNLITDEKKYGFTECPIRNKTIISIMENKNYPNSINPIAKYTETLTVEVN